METYALTEDANVVQRNSDGAFIPNDPLNADWQDYQAWLAKGNEPAPYVPPASAKPALRGSHDNS